MKETDFVSEMNKTVQENFDGVVVGWDIKYSYRKVSRAVCVLNGGKINRNDNTGNINS